MKFCDASKRLALGYRETLLHVTAILMSTLPPEKADAARRFVTSRCERYKRKNVH